MRQVESGDCGRRRAADHSGMLLVEVPSATAYVTRNIEHLRVGDRVLARDQHDPAAPLKAKRIEALFERTAYRLTVVTVRSSSGLEQTLYTTNEHPVYVPGRGWVAGRELRVGDELLEPTGEKSTVVATRTEQHPRGITVYNFRVADSHTYFVREEGSTAEPVWVHNAVYIDQAILNRYAEINNGPNAGMIEAINPESNLVEAYNRAELDGDHALSKQVFKDTVAEFEEANGLKLSKPQWGEVNALRDGPENLRPMPRSYNRSKGDLPAMDWAQVDSDIASRVDAEYISDLQAIQDSVALKLSNLLNGFLTTTGP